MEYQITLVEVSGTFSRIPISILIDTGAKKKKSPRIVHKMSRKFGYMKKSWVVECANQTRAKVSQCLFEARVELPSFSIEVNLYVAPLGSYDVILAMN